MTNDPQAVNGDTDDSSAAAAGDDATGTDDTVQTELAAALAEVAKLRDLAARAQADLQNVKVRVERDADELRRFAAENMIRRILPTLDNFQRAFLHVPQDLASHEWVKGVSAIESDLMRQMSDAGLTRMDSLGSAVDPMRHEVLSVGPGEDGKVAEVFEEGYELHGKVIRPAKVRAGDGTES